jgi:hypothetical protein
MVPEPRPTSLEPQEVVLLLRRSARGGLSPKDVENAVVLLLLRLGLASYSLRCGSFAVWFRTNIRFYFSVSLSLVLVVVICRLMGIGFGCICRREFLFLLRIDGVEHRDREQRFSPRWPKPSEQQPRHRISHLQSLSLMRI